MAYKSKQDKAKWMREYRARKKSEINQIKQIAKGSNTPPPRSMSDDIGIVEESWYIDTEVSANWKRDRDPIKEINQDAYQLFRRSPVSMHPLTKIAKDITAMDFVACTTKDGEIQYADKSERAAAFQDILDFSMGWSDLYEHMKFGFVEGVVANFIKVAPKVEGRQWVYMDFTDGGIHKKGAHPTNPENGFVWDRKTVAKGKTSSALATTQQNQAKSFPPYPGPSGKLVPQCLVFHPGSSTSSEGDLSRARYLLPLCSAWELAFRNMNDFGNLVAFPWIIAESLTEGLSRAQSAELKLGMMNAIQNILQQKGSTTQGVVGGPTGPTPRTAGISSSIPGVGISRDQKLSLLETKGEGAKIVLDWLQTLEDLGHKFLLGNTMSSDTKGNPTGTHASTLHGGEQNKYMVAYTKDYAECLSLYLYDWIVGMNPDLPKLEDGEQEVRFKFIPAGTRPGLNNAEEEADELEDAMEPNEEDPKDEMGEVEGADDEDAPTPPAQLMKLRAGDVVVVAANPYSIVRRGLNHCVISSQDGETIKCHDSRDLAIRHLGLLEGALAEAKEE